MTKKTLKKQILTLAVLAAVMGVSAVANAEYNWRDYSSDDMDLGDNPIVGNSDPSEIFTKEIDNIKTPGTYTHATTETGVIGATGIDLEFKRDAYTSTDPSTTKAKSTFHIGNRETANDYSSHSYGSGYAITITDTESPQGVSDETKPTAQMQLSADGMAFKNGKGTTSYQVDGRDGKVTQNYNQNTGGW